MPYPLSPNWPGDPADTEAAERWAELIEAERLSRVHLDGQPFKTDHPLAVGGTFSNLLNPRQG
jgi:hypothetical protein